MGLTTLTLVALWLLLLSVAGLIFHTLRSPDFTRLETAFGNGRLIREPAESGDSDPDIDPDGAPSRFERFLKDRSDLLVTIEAFFYANLVGVTALLFARVAPWPAENATAGEWAVCSIQIVGLVLLVSLVAHVVPWAWSQVGGERLLVKAWPVLRLLTFLFRPLTGLAHRFERLIARLHGVDPDAESEQATPEDVRTFIREGRWEGLFDDETGRMMNRIMALANNDVASIMTIRRDMVTLPMETTLEEARRIQEEGHSRIPVYDESIEDIVGLLYAKDLLSFLGDETRDPASETLRQVPLRKVQYVSEMMSLDALFETMREKKTHLQIVLDEYGSVCGLVTMEDLLEEIVGDIEDEYETEEKEEPIRFVDEGHAVVDAEASLLEVEEKLGLALPDGDYETVAGFVISQMGRIPEVGEELAHDGFVLEVTGADDRRIRTLSVTRSEQTLPTERAS